MSQPDKPLIGSVFERKVGAPASAPGAQFNAGAKTGFPAVQHRSKSAFARNREISKTVASAPERSAEPPAVEPVPPLHGAVLERPTGLQASSPEEWRKQVSEDNARRVAVMSEEERKRERAELEEQFGKGIGDMMKKVRAAREAREARERQQGTTSQSQTTLAVSPVPSAELPEIQHIETVVPEPADMRMVQSAKPRSPSPSPSPILSSASTRPSSPARGSRKLRFADITPKDVHVYESAPPSPRKKVLALPPPSGDGSAISLGQWKPRTPASVSVEDAGPPVAASDIMMSSPTSPTKLSAPPPSSRDLAPAPAKDGPDAGTPEDIRRRWFPNASAHDPNLEWMESLPLPDPTSANSIRFDLKGNPISLALSATLPTHLGLHHHAEGTRAGYTLDDIFLLSRSTVPSQRATMLGVLAKIARRVGRMKRGITEDAADMQELVGKEEELRKRILAAGVEAIGERAYVGAQAVDVFWECVVGWDEELASIDGVELQEEQPSGLPSDEETNAHSKRDAISSLPLDFVLEQIATVFGATALPHESLLQLLSILHRLAKHTNDIATAITATPALITNLLRLFILTPIPPRSDSPQPSPLAINLLTTLALSSRTAATSLLDPADSLLRFVTLLPLSSPYPLPLSAALLTQTLHLYTAFASYGLYSHIATTASEPLARLSVYILSPECESRSLLTAYARLLEAWIVCAVDPHQTTPEHDILWSQVVGWGWAQDVVELKGKLTTDEADWPIWSAAWRAEAAWLEGSRVNGIKGGEGERHAVLEQVKPGFDGGKERDVFLSAMGAFKRTIDDLEDGYNPSKGLASLHNLSSYATICAATVRLWLACLPPTSEALAEPPFQLPFSLLEHIFATIVSHPFVESVYKPSTPPYVHAFYRALAVGLGNYACLSRRMPTISDDICLAQAGVVLIRLMPGEEGLAQSMLKIIADVVNEKFLSSRGWNVPSAIWERGGMKVILPFLTFSLRTHEDSIVGPVVPTPRAIKVATTQRLPPAWAVRRREHGSGLPYSRDWPLIPLDHVLRSGTSPIWKQLPQDWDASETDVVRVALLLARVMRVVLQTTGLLTFTMQRAEVVLACMKVFMLEHGQVQGAPGESGGLGSEEVFRDSTVAAFMEDLIAPCTLGASFDGLSALPALSSSQSTADENLEIAAERFLGSGTPFYQFYTDFVALYDAISFGHPLFASLLLPPTSRQYATDYRKLLFNETAHVLGTVRTPIDRVIGGHVGEYLWPVEDDPQVIGAYLGLLVGRRTRVPIEGFVRYLVVHHIAANIWTDLREEAPGPSPEARGRRLLEAVFSQGRPEDVRDVVLYWQRRVGRVVLPPQCFDLGERKGNRLAWVKAWAADGLVQRIEGLLGTA